MLQLDVVSSFSQMGSHPSFLIGKLCRSAFSLILARSYLLFWTGRDVSSAEVRGLHENLSLRPLVKRITSRWLGSRLRSR